MENKLQILLCPNCGNRLCYSMPDGSYLFCNKCNKCFENNYGEVGTECDCNNIYPNNNADY